MILLVWSGWSWTRLTNCLKKAKQASVTRWPPSTRPATSQECAGHCSVPHCPMGLRTGHGRTWTMSSEWQSGSGQSSWPSQPSATANKPPCAVFKEARVSYHIIPEMVYHNIVISSVYAFIDCNQYVSDRVNGKLVQRSKIIVLEWLWHPLPVLYHCYFSVHTGIPPQKQWSRNCYLLVKSLESC